MAQSKKNKSNGTDRQREERRARLEEMRRAEEARGRRNRILMVAGGAVLAAAVVTGGWFAVQAAKGDGEKADKEQAQIDPGKANVKGEKVYKKLARGHVETPVDYPESPNPPVGGKHSSIWQNGNGDIYTKPLKLVHAVHTLEHGAVWVTYGESAAKSDLAAMEKKVEGVPFRFMSPNPGQKAPITLSAWGHQLTVKNAEDPRIDKFFKAYVQGPQTPEPGAMVTNGRPNP